MLIHKTKAYSSGYVKEMVIFAIDNGITCQKLSRCLSVSESYLYQRASAMLMKFPSNPRQRREKIKKA